MSGSRQRMELAELIQRELDGSLDHDGFLRLQNLLDADPGAVQYYYRTIVAAAAFSAPSVISDSDRAGADSGLLTDSCWEALAAEEMTSPAIDLPEPEPRADLIRGVSHEKLIGSLKKSTIIGIAANMAAILLLFFFIRYAPIRGKSYAYVLETYQAAAQNEIRAGQYLDGKIVKLDRGLVKLQMNDGTIAVLEGPSEICLENDDQLFLISGKVAVHVPPEAVGFTVRTPSASVIDYGTDFAVKVDQFAATEAHVLKGTVKVGVGSNPRVLERTRRLSANQAACVSGGSLRVIAADVNQFVYDLPSQFELAARSLGVSMYLQVQADSPGSLRDKVHVPSEAIEINPNLTVVPGPFAAQGINSYALHLQGDDSAVRITDTTSVPQSSSGAFSIAYWVRFDRIGKQVVSYNRVQTAQGAHYRSVTMTERGLLQHAAHDPAFAPMWRIVRSPQALEPGVWYFIVISRDVRGDNTKRMYINGKLAAENAVDDDPVKLRPFDCFQFGGRVGQFSGFSGDLAEMLLFPRALDGREVKALYESATDIQQ